ncbi:hypothetical protein, partial [Aliivibrio sp. 1S175]
DFILSLLIFISLLFVFFGDGFLELVGIYKDQDRYAPLLGTASAFYFGFAYALILTRRNIRHRHLVEELESLKIQRNTLRPLKSSDNVT